MKRLVLLPLLLLACACAAAECSDGTQSEMNACAAWELRAADTELNQVYRAILRSHSGDPLFIEKLKAAQRIWIQLRDADLEAQFPLAPGQSAQFEYGSIYPFEHANAQAELTRERTRYLRANWLLQSDR